MLKVGITGGIGSGKTTVCAFFEVLGIPVFYADEAARDLMQSDAVLRGAIGALFGEHLYTHERLDRAALGAAVFGDSEKLAALNALVHPAAIAAAGSWMDRQQSPYAIKEAAIFFESGSDRYMDVMIGVWAPQELRIARAMGRSALSKAQVMARIGQQMDEEEKMRRCDFVIRNDDREAVSPQILQIHQHLLQRSGAQ